MQQEDCSASILSHKHQALREWSAILAIISSSVSIVGCLLIIIIYVCWKDFRTTARSILLFISIADFFTATGYVIGSASYLHYKIYNNSTNTSATSCNPDDLHNHPYRMLCRWQSFITTTSSVASFYWTVVLAFYLYMTIVHKMYKFVRRIMPFIHLISWGVPLVLGSVAMKLGWLGLSLDDTAVSWCFVKFDKPPSVHHARELLLGKGWEVISYILVIIFYMATKVFIELKKRRPLQYPAYATVLRMDKKVLFIPIAFLLVRMWGTIRYFISLLPLCKDHCHSCSCNNILYHPLLVYLQAIGDGAQGWSNAIIFIVFSTIVRQRITQTVSSASCKLLHSTSSNRDNTVTDYGTINPQDDRSSGSLNTNTPTSLYGSISPKTVK